MPFVIGIWLGLTSNKSQQGTVDNDSVDLRLNFDVNLRQPVNTATVDNSDHHLYHRKCSLQS